MQKINEKRAVITKESGEHGKIVKEDKKAVRNETEERM
jgi:hypothetical protein